jgi:hypothetical protein
MRSSRADVVLSDELPEAKCICVSLGHRAREQVSSGADVVLSVSDRARKSERAYLTDAALAAHEGSLVGQVFRGALNVRYLVVETLSLAGCVDIVIMGPMPAGARLVLGDEYPF